MGKFERAQEEPKANLLLLYVYGLRTLSESQSV
jgi:hypothetical protein